MFVQELLLRAHSCEGDSCWCLHDLPARFILRFGTLVSLTTCFSWRSLTQVYPFSWLVVLRQEHQDFSKLR